MPEFPELREPKAFTPEERAHIDDLKRLFTTRNDISFQTDEYFLTKFLRLCDWNAEKAFASAINYYELKKLNPQHYAQKNVSEYMDILMLNSRVLLDKRDKCGRAVFVGKLGKNAELCYALSGETIIIQLNRKRVAEHAVLGRDNNRRFVDRIAAQRSADPSEWNINNRRLQGAELHDPEVVGAEELQNGRC